MSKALIHGQLATLTVVTATRTAAVTVPVGAVTGEPALSLCSSAAQTGCSSGVRLRRQRQTIASLKSSAASRQESRWRCRA